ncbi:fibronectin type III domain-containing protein [Haloferula sargassicola]|uniref:Two component regulator three Y domain-containing protein n=1 Tax=Haloferula sargassicola TaxID=490096 RepID=A0ABP9ULH3_9BACT
MGPLSAAPRLSCELTPDAAGRLVSNDGTIDLRWSEKAGSEFELQQAREADFSRPHLRYRGTDHETVLTGLAEGTYHFRVRETPDGEWSEPLVFEVEYMNRGPLFLLLGTGAFVALSTIVAILHGYSQNR